MSAGPYAAGAVPYPPDCADCPNPEECKAANDCQVLRQIRHPSTPKPSTAQSGTWNPNETLEELAARLKQIDEFVAEVNSTAQSGTPLSDAMKSRYRAVTTASEQTGVVVDMMASHESLERRALAAEADRDHWKSCHTAVLGTLCATANALQLARSELTHLRATSPPARVEGE